MGIRALLLAAALTLAPGAALAQGQSPWIPASPAVPPPAKPLVGPREDYNGERASPTRIIPAGTPTIGPPGSAVPPPRVITSDPTTAAEKVATGSGVADATATLMEEGANKLAPVVNNIKGGKELVTDLNRSANSLTKTAAVGSAVANAQVAREKCSDANATGAECLQASLNSGSSVAGLVNATRGAQVLQVAGDATGAYNNCYAKEEATWLDCVQSLADTGVSLGSNLPGGGKAISATYSIAKVIAPAAFDRVGTALLGKSPGEWLYDKFRAADEDARIEAQSSSPEMLDQIRARRRAAYAAAAGELMSKQADYDRQQAQIAANQQAAAQQAAQQQASAYQAQNLLNNFNAVLRPQLSPSRAPSGQSICDEMHMSCRVCSPFIPGLSCNGASPPTPAPAPAPAPSSSGGCGLTAADRAAGKVCTAN